jgi:hypothetical protein
MTTFRNAPISQNRKQKIERELNARNANLPEWRK